MRRLAGMLAALVIVATGLFALPAQSAQAADCWVTKDNSLLHPTATAKCKTRAKYGVYRVEAICWPGIKVVGEWERQLPSKARCFLTDVTAAWIAWKSSS